jgi:glycosyltransferase involved in cell wall biosynthesis
MKNPILSLTVILYQVNNSEIFDLFKKHKCCVIIPTYNNQASISKVIDDVLLYCNDVYVINDGSTDDTLSIINKYKDQVKIISYKNNKGKGYALRTGFKKTYEDGYLYAITIDADGQHFASDFEGFLKQIPENPEAVIIGARKKEQENKSKGSKFANEFSNFWYKIETGETIEDSQCGYRLYPLKTVNKLKYFTTKYEFEIEIIVRLNWRGCRIMTIPINVYYPPPEKRVSHFRPGKDVIRISMLNTVLVTLALIFFLPRNIFRKYKNKSLKRIFREDVLGRNTSTRKISASIGFGVFMGIMPIWGYQLLIGLSLAHFMKLNKAIVFLAANISIPPMIPLILYLSYVSGGFLLGEGTWAVSLNDITFETIKNDILQYLAGAWVLATVAGLFFWLTSWTLLKIVQYNRRRNA